MDAYLSGLEQRVQDGGSLTGIESVASFFVSRVDTEIDRRLDKAGADPSLKGKAALANAQLAYQAYEEVFSSGRWRALQAQGASTQRPLWASTGVKNQDYPDTLYVSGLIAPDTVNTMPEKTLKSYADHGSPGTPIQRTYDEAAQVMKAVADAGVDLDDVFAGPRGRGHPEVHRLLGRAHRVSPLGTREQKMKRTRRTTQQVTGLLGKSPGPGHENAPAPPGSGRAG